MKFDPKFIVRVAGTLTAIALVTAALLGLVNKVTAPNILAINKEKTEKAMSEVVTDPASEFSDALEVTQEYKDAAAAYGTITELYEVSVGGEKAGHVMKIVASGSQGNIEMMVGVDANKAVTGVAVVDHAETSGIGTKVTGNEPTAAGVGVLDQFKGQTMANGALEVGKGIDAISGATVSSRGVTKGVNAALAVAELLG